MIRPKYFLLFTLSVFLISQTGYTQQTILVAPRDTDANVYAQQLALEAETVVAERSFHRALLTAAELLNTGEDVTIKVASGEYDGKAGQGVWNLPKVDNPQGQLVLSGGWNSDFSAQQPFRQPTWLITSAGRPDAFISFTRNSKLQSLVISGFVMDAQPSNRYEVLSGSLSKNGSRELPLIRFSYLLTDHLEISNNVFANAALGVFDPQIYPASNQTRIDIHNNFFLNNVIPIQQLGAWEYRGNKVQTINLTQNTFLSNWPLHYSPTSSNVGAVTLYHSGGAQQLLIQGNIFAHNPGGAMQHDWPESQMPPLTISDNLFFDNASLFKKREEYGLVVGKFGTNPRYLILDIETLEDDFDYNCSGNVVADPGISLAPYLERIVKSAYAPAFNFLPDHLPVPSNPELAGYGVQVK